MIASRLGLAVLAAIAVALGGLLAADLARDGGGAAGATHELVPAADAAAITAVAWARAGQPAVGITHSTSGDGWLVDDPPGAADPDAVDAVLAALRGGRWHRRVAADRVAAVPPRATVTVRGGEHVYTLGIGRDLDGGEQGWILSGGDALLVDAWVMHALDPAPLALRLRAPLAGAAGRVVFRRGDVLVQLDLARGVLGEPEALVLAPERVVAVAEALGGLVITHVPPASPQSDDGLVIGAGSRTLQLAGPCPDAPDEELVTGRTGRGCVARAAVAALESTVALLAGAPEAIVNPRPLAARPDHITLGDGATLLLDKRPRLAGGEDVAGERVAELLAALAAPGAPVPLPGGEPQRTLIATPIDSAVPVTLDLYAGDVVVRRGEPVGLHVTHEAYAKLVASSRALEDTALWADDPTAIAQLTVDGKVFARGAVLGEWTGGGSGDAAPLEVLAAAVAAPRTVGDDAPPSAATGKTHRVAVEVRDPVGPAVRREVEVEAVGARCALRAAGKAVWVASAACAAVERLAFAVHK